MSKASLKSKKGLEKKLRQLDNKFKSPRLEGLDNGDIMLRKVRKQKVKNNS